MFHQKFGTGTIMGIAEDTLTVQFPAGFKTIKAAYVQPAAEAAREVPAEVDPFAGGYPVPPLPGQRLVEPARGRTSSAVTTSAPSTTAVADDTTTTTSTDEEQHRG